MFHNDIIKNLLLLNVATFNMFRKQIEDAMNLGETSYMAYVTHGTWMQHDQDQSRCTRPSKHNIRFIDSPIVLYWEGHNSFIRSVIKVNDHLMKSLFDKLSNGSDLYYRQSITSGL